MEKGSAGIQTSYHRDLANEERQICDSFMKTVRQTVCSRCHRQIKRLHHEEPPSGSQMTKIYNSPKSCTQ